MIVIAEETSGFRRSGLSPDLWLLIPTFSLPSAPARLTAHLRGTGNAPLPLGDFIKDPILWNRKKDWSRVVDLPHGFPVMSRASSAPSGLKTNSANFPLRNHRTRAFGTMLSPGKSSAHLASPINRNRVVSYYALFKGWLLLSQPPTCLRQNTSFNT